MTDGSEKSLWNGVNFERKDYKVPLDEGCSSSSSSGEDRIE